MWALHVIMKLVWIPQGIRLHKCCSEASQIVYIFHSKLCCSIHISMHTSIHASTHTCMHTHKEVSAWLWNAAGAIKNNKTWRNLREMVKRASPKIISRQFLRWLLCIYIYRAADLHSISWIYVKIGVGSVFSGFSKGCYLSQMDW